MTRRIVTAREQYEMLAPWREANSAGGGVDPNTNMRRQVTRADARAQEARDRGEHDLADYLENLRDHMTSQADLGYPRPWSHYEPMAHEEFDIHTAAAHPDAHPDLHDAFARHGVVHTSHGRRLDGGLHTAAADFTGPQDTTFSGFNDPAGWSYHKSFEPSQIARQGARAYSSLVGLPDPHNGSIDYLNAKRHPDEMRAAAQHYDSLPLYQPEAVPHFDSLHQDINRQHDFMTHRLGINTEITDHDPYSDVHEMLADINNNKRLQVLGTHVTGGHPYLDDATNDKLRAVHDFFGHAATGRSFDRHGEQAAWMAHAQMFSPHAHPALATETKGQNSSLVFNGQFAPQKTALLHPQHWAHDLSSPLSYSAGIVRKSAISYEAGIQDNTYPQAWQDKAEELARQTGGFTIHNDPNLPHDAPETGYQVAIPGYEDTTRSTGQGWADYAAEHQGPLAGPNRSLGTWRGDDDLFYTEPSERIEDYDQAARATVDRDQWSMWGNDAFRRDPATGEKIWHTRTGPGGELTPTADIPRSDIINQGLAGATGFTLANRNDNG